MKRLLYVDCCIRGQASRTRRLAEAFLDALPQDWVVEPLEWAAEGLQYFSGPFFQQRQDLLDAGNRTHPRFRYAWQFAQADAIVLAAPLWDLSFPALLKVYIENVSVEGITFGCGAAGCYGICRAQRMAFLTTRGSVYEGSHLEMGSRYLQAMAEFFGIGRYDCVAADGLDAAGHDPEAILRTACKQAAELARKF